MKTTFLTLLAVAAALPLVAQQEPPPEAPKPEANEEKAAGWLGVSAEASGDELLGHLGIEQGVTLSLVAEGSPADKAGLAENNVLTAVDGKAVGTMEELRDAIRAHKEGAEVDLTLYQQGKKVEKKVTLGAAPAVGGALLGAAPGLRILPAPGNMPQLQMQLRGLQGGNMFQFGREGLGRGSIRVNDRDGSVEVKTVDKNKEVTVYDETGEIEFEGPWDTPQDKAAAPPDIKRRIDALDFVFGGGGNPFRVEINPGNIPPPPPDPEVEEDPFEEDGEPEPQEDGAEPPAPVDE